MYFDIIKMLFTLDNIPDWVYINNNVMKIYLLELREAKMQEFSKLLLEGKLPATHYNKEDARKWKVKINSTINHVSEGRSNFRPPVVKPVDQFFDKTSLYEMRIKLSDYLLRIFFACYLNEIIILNFLVKPFKYEKRVKKKVDIEYDEKISEAKNYYIRVIRKQINLDEYIKI